MEELLVIRLKNRDKAAMAEMYDLYSASLYGVILRIVKDKLLAEDILQDCFVKIWFSFPLFDSQKGHLYTWLVALARNLAIDAIRSCAYRQGRQNQNLDCIYDLGLRETTPFKPEHIGIKELMATLPADYKKVVDLLYFKGYTHLEAAKVLAIPLGTLKTRVRHALQILRKIMIEPEVLAA